MFSNTSGNSCRSGRMNNSPARVITERRKLGTVAGLSFLFQESPFPSGDNREKRDSRFSSADAMDSFEGAISRPVRQSTTGTLPALVARRQLPAPAEENGPKKGIGFTGMELVSNFSRCRRGSSISLGTQKVHGTTRSDCRRGMGHCTSDGSIRKAASGVGSRFRKKMSPFPSPFRTAWSR